MRRLGPVLFGLSGLFCLAMISGATSSAASRKPPMLLFERGGGCIDYTGLYLYTVRADGSELRRLTHDGDSSDGRWSPDGRRIVFTRGNGDCTSAAESDIFVMRADGSGVRRLTRDRDDWEGSFSPDGRKLVFGQGDSIVVSDTNAKHRRIIVKGARLPAWSPDGRRILYGALNGMWVVDLATGRKRHLAGGSTNSFSNGVWSPDGTSIVVPRMHKSSGTYKLWLMRTDRSARTQLTKQTTDESNDVQPTWSPDGKQIAFVRSNGQSADLILLTVKGRSERKLLHAVDLGGPAWSKDGSWIAFGGTWARRKGLWIVHPDGTGLRQLTNSRGRVAEPDAVQWQP